MRRFLRSFRGLIASLPARRPAEGAAGALSAACVLFLGLVLAFGSRASAQVFADNFADGIVSAYWQQVSASPSVTMVERNSRAELTTTANAGLTTAHYAGFLAKGWSIRCTSNWAARAVVHSEPRTNGALPTTEYVSVGTFRPGSPLSATGFPTQSKLFNVGTIYIEPQYGGFNRRVEYTAYDQFGNASYIATPWAANAGYPFEFYTATSAPVYAFDFTYTETLYLQYVAASDTLYVSNYSYNDPEGFFFVNWTGGQRYPVALAIGGFANRPATTTGVNTWIDSVSVDVGVLDTAPGNVAASDGTFGNKVRVTWTAAANATGYKVLRQAAGGSVEQIAQLGQAALAYDDTTALPLVEYTYFVRTINALGDGFEFSDTGWRNVAVPSGVAASDGTFTDKVRVTWTASTGAVGYSVWRAIGTGTPVLLGQTSGESATTYDDTTAAIATTYTYSVKAVSVLGSTGFSTSDTGVRAPAPPADVAASDGTYAAKVRVSWTALNGATGYRIYRRIEGGVATQIAVVTGGTTAFYDDTTATPLTTYLYSVKTTTTSVDSATSDENSGWRNLAAPTLAASQGTSESGVVLTWSAVAGATGYELFRTAPGGSAQPLASLEAVTGFTDTTADPLVIYTYTAKSVHPLGLSPSSAAVTGWRNVPGPSAVVASDGSFATKVQVEWTSVSGATGYTVWRKLPSAAAYAQIGTVAGGATVAYADTTAAVATTYQYAVKATNTAGATAFSPSDTGWRNTTAPGSVAASDGTYGDKVRVTWTAAPSATGYKVFRTEPGGSAVEIASVAATALLFDDTTAAPAVNFSYTVRAVLPQGQSAAAVANTGWRATAAPTAVAASDGTYTDKVRITWTAPAAATGYKVFRKQGTAAPVQIGTVASGSTTTFDDTTAAIAVFYAYSVQSVCALGAGGTSAADNGVRAPGAPTNVAASDGTFTDKVRVTWTAVNGASGYKVFRRASGGAAATLIGTVTGGTTALYDDATAVALTTYLYSVKTLVGTSESAAGAEESGWRNAAGPAAAASAGTSLAGVNLSWTATTGATGYRLFRTAPGGTAQLLAELGVVTSHVDETAEPLVSYAYSVRAVHALGTTPAGAAANGWRNIAGPATLAATDGTSANKVGLAWSAVTGATGYTVWRKLPSAAAYAQIATVAGGATVVYDDTTAAVATTYSYVVRATHALGSTPNSVADTGWRNTTAPGSVAASDGTYSDKVRVTWTAAPSATGYKVFRTEPGGSAVEIASVAATALLFDDTTAAPAVNFSYTVRAVLPQGQSAAGTANTGWRATAAPTAVAASDGTYTDKVRVTWTAPDAATGYKIFRKQGTAAPVQIGTVASGSTTTFDDTTAAIAVVYAYSVQSVCALGAGGTSAADNGVRAPGAPTNVAASDGTFTDKVRVTWTAVNGASGYKVFRRASGGAAATLIGTVTGGTTALYDDATAVALTTYLYSVKTLVGTSESAAGAEESGWRNAAGPAATASAGTSLTGVNLSWTATTGATGYRLFRTAPGGTAQLLAELGVVTSHVDETAEPLVSYAYSVRAVHALGTTPSGAAANGWRNIAGPATLAATDGTSANKVGLAWSAVTGATGYTVWRKLPSAAAYAQIATVAGGATVVYDDTTAAVATTYSYVVRATHALGSTPNSVADTGWRNTTAPGSVAASDGTYGDKVRVTWTAAPSATGYKVFRTEPGGSETQIGTTNATTLVFDDTTAPPAVTLTYRVRATVTQGDGPMSVANTGWRQVAVPVASASDGAFADKVRVTWPAVGGASSYKIFRKIGTGANTQIGTVAAGGTTEFNDTTITPLVQANYSVEAVSPLGGSSTSAVNIGWRNRPAPASVAASDGTFPTKVRITWAAVTSATGYQVFRQIAGGAVTQIGTTTATTLAFDDTTIAVGQTGSYTVKATHALGTTAASTADDGFRAPPFDGGIAGDGDGTADGGNGGNGGGGGGSDGGSGDGLDDNIDNSIDEDLGDETDTTGDQPDFDPTDACVTVEARIAGRLASAELVDTTTRAMLASLLEPVDATDAGATDGVTKACAIRAGDVDLDGRVTVSDLVAFLAAWADRDEFRGDVNRDGFVDALDYAEVYLRVAEASGGSDDADAPDASGSAD